MKKVFLIATILTALFTMPACVTGKPQATKAKQVNSSEGTLETTHIETMAQGMKTSLSNRLKNLGACKDSLKIDPLENRTGVSVDMKRVQATLTQKITEVKVTLIAGGRCRLFGALALQEARGISTYTLTATIENQAKEMVWADRQVIKIKH